MHKGAAAACLAEIAMAIVTTGVQSVAGFPQLIFRDLSWSDIPRSGFRGAGVAARGTFIAVPALVVFGSLLTSADPMFARVLRNLFLIDDFSDFLVHIFVIAIGAAICAGFLRSLALSGPMPRMESGFVSLPAAETNFALLLINLLFASFVAVQFTYFFRETGMRPAEYARRGFFELVWVVALGGTAGIARDRQSPSGRSPVGGRSAVE